MQKRITKILAAAEPNGNVNVVRQLVKEAKKVRANAIALLGSLSPRGSDPRKYGQVLKELSEARTPAFYVPGPEDAPLSELLREAASIEVVYPDIHGVHATFAMASGQLLVSGLGGSIGDDPKTTRDELVALRYPGWELEYRLKFLRELKNYRKMFLFTTPPRHGHLDEKGSAAVTEIIKTWNPAIVLVGGRGQKYELLGTSRVIACGSLAEGTFKVVDLEKQEVVSGTLHQPATAA